MSLHLNLKTYNQYLLEYPFFTEVPSVSKAAWKTPPVTPDKPLHEILSGARQRQSKMMNAESSSSVLGHRQVDRISKRDERETEGSTDVGRMASKLRAEAQLASSLFSGEDARKQSLSQLMQKSKYDNSSKQDSVDG